MTIQDMIADDITNVFAVEANTPLSKQAVYTPEGGIAQAAITGLFSNTPLTGDEQQFYGVEQETIVFMAKTSDVSGWKIRGTVTIESFDYEIAKYPYPTDSYWSLVFLRTPIRNRTKI